MTSRAELLLSIAGRTDVYGEEQPDGSMKVVYKPLTRQVLQDHLAGRRNVGVFLISPEGLVRGGSFIIREHSPRVRLTLIKLKGKLKELIEVGTRFLIEEIPEEGYRGWVIFPKPSPAWLVASLFRSLADQAAEPDMPIETAPTEEEVRRLGFLTAEEVAELGLPLRPDHSYLRPEERDAS